MLDLIAVLLPIFVTLFWGTVFLFSSFSGMRIKAALAIFMFTSFLLYCCHAIFFQGDKLLYFKIEPVYILTNLAVYPLFYFYLRLLILEERIKMANLLLLTPALLLSVVSFTAGTLVSDTQALAYIDHFLIQRDFKFFPVFSPLWLKMIAFLISRALFIIAVFYTLTKGLIMIHEHEKRIINYFPNFGSRSFIWLKILLFLLLSTSAMSVVFSLIGRDFFLHNGTVIIPSIIFSSLMFGIGYQGNRLTPLVIQPNSAPEVGRNAEVLKTELLAMFNESLIYKNPNLHMGDVSRKLKTDNYSIAEVINKEFKLTFSDFVNQYRINVAKGLIQQCDVLNVSEIAFESGFNSSGSFMAAFKASAGMNPQRYKMLVDELKNQEISGDHR